MGKKMDSFKKQKAGKSENTVLINFCVPPAFKKRFKITAAELEMSQSALLQKVFEEWEKSVNEHNQ
jgi:hypothetical protein